MSENRSFKRDKGIILEGEVSAEQSKGDNHEYAVLGEEVLYKRSSKGDQHELVDTEDDRNDFEDKSKEYSPHSTVGLHNLQDTGQLVSSLSESVQGCSRPNIEDINEKVTVNDINTDKTKEKDVKILTDSVLLSNDSSEHLHLVDLEGNEGDLNDKLLLEELCLQSSQFLEEDNSNEPNSLNKACNFTCQVELDLIHSPNAWLSKNRKTFVNAWTLSNIDKLYKSDFDCLPNELILKIFSYLSTREVCQHIAPVCRKWRQFSRDNSLWKCIDFSFNPHLPSLDFLWVVRKAPHLHKLVIRGRTNITQAEVAILSEICPELREIDFGFCDDLNSAMIQCLSENCLSLNKLNVEGCEKLDRRSIKYFTRCKNLTHINFSHCLLEDSSVIYLVNNLSCIHSLNLDGIAFVTDRSVKALVNKHRDNLVELELDGAEISDIAIEQITWCKQLKHLGISFCDCLTDKSLEHIKSLKHLHTLRLRKGSDFSSEALQIYFMEAPLTALRSLNISECTNVDDDVILQMAKTCGRQLHDLSLSWCWFITDTGLISIVDHCCNLGSLDLLGIDKIRGECLGRIPEELPRLTFLDLRQCNQIVDSLIVDVVRRKRDLRVINYYGEEFVSLQEPSTL